MSEVTVRVAHDDAAGIAAVRLLLQAYGRWRGHDAALGDFQQELESLPGEYGAPGGCLLLAETPNGPAGCIAFRRLDTETCEMKRMWVLPDHQRRGIARKMASQLLIEAARAGYGRMVLDTHPRMVEAQQLYRQLGFTEIARYNANPTPGIRFFARAL